MKFGTKKIDTSRPSDPLPAGRGTTASADAPERPDPPDKTELAKRPDRPVRPDPPGILMTDDGIYARHYFCQDCVESMRQHTDRMMTDDDINARRRHFVQDVVEKMRKYTDSKKSRRPDFIVKPYMNSVEAFLENPHETPTGFVGPCCLDDQHLEEAQTMEDAEESLEEKKNETTGWSSSCCSSETGGTSYLPESDSDLPIGSNNTACVDGNEDHSDEEEDDDDIAPSFPSPIFRHIMVRSVAEAMEHQMEAARNGDNDPCIIVGVNDEDFEDHDAADGNEEHSEEEEEDDDDDVAPAFPSEIDRHAMVRSVADAVERQMEAARDGGNDPCIIRGVNDEDFEDRDAAAAFRSRIVPDTVLPVLRSIADVMERRMEEADPNPNNGDAGVARG